MYICRGSQVNAILALFMPTNAVRLNVYEFVIADVIISNSRPMCGCSNWEISIKPPNVVLTMDCCGLPQNQNFILLFLEDETGV